MAQHSDHAPSADHDVLVVGAGFGGLNALWNLRSRGHDVLLIEAGEDVGGTWFWNRYPGARVDIESMEYSYGFLDELQQEWSWTEKYASQPEVRRYLGWVADRLDLRTQIRLGNRVTSLSYDGEHAMWNAMVNPVDGGQPWTVTARHVVLATGFLSTPNLPDIEGVMSFEGEIAHTGAWPDPGPQTEGRKVGVIGTAASGVQVVQELAPSVGHLTVFQRTANWCFPLRNRPMEPDYEAFVKSNYQDIRRLEHEGRGPGMVLIDGRIVPSETRGSFDVTADERLADFEWRWKAGGVHMGRSFNDLIRDPRANDELRRFLEDKIRDAVDDPETAKTLTPTHPPLSRRPPGEAGYYAAFNRPNVDLVDAKSDPIERITANGVRLASGRVFELDTLIFATGFDASTGAARRIDIVGRDGARLADQWRDGARTYLGLATAGFPNMYFINGPQSPGPHFSPPLLCDFQSKLLCELLDRLDKSDATSIETTQEAEAEWLEHANSIYAATMIWDTDSWWVGANIPGKPRQALAYGGGFPEYRRRAEKAVETLDAFVLT